MDGVAPLVTLVNIPSNTAGSAVTFRDGDEIIVSLVFSENIVFTGNKPFLNLVVGRGIRTATYHGYAATINAVTFNYEVAAMDFDPDGITVPANNLSLSGGTMKDAAGNDVVLGHPAVQGDAGNQVLGSTGTPMLSIRDATGAENAGPITFMVSLAAPSGYDTMVNYATADGTGDAAATDGVDYTGQSGALTINAGQTSATFEVPILDDTGVEGDETFTVTLTSPMNAVFARAAATGTIQDNDLPEVTVSFDQATYEVSEGGAVTVAVELSAVPGRSVTIPLQTGDLDGASSDDYSVPASVAFAANETSKEIVFTATDDTEDDDGETVALSFGAALPDGISAGTPATATVAILDNDEPGVSIAGESVMEDAGTLTFTVTLTPAASGEVTVNYATGADTTPGTDFTPASGTLTFSAGETEKTVALTITDDETDEDDQEVTMTLSGASGAPIAIASATGTILDDDPAPTVGYGASSYEVAEDAGSVDIVMTLTPPAEKPIEIVSFLTPRTAFHQAPGRDGDYVDDKNNVLGLPPGTASWTRTITILDDSLPEVDEFFEVWARINDLAHLGDRAIVRVQILDNDVRGLVFVPAKLEVDEGQTTSYTIKLNAQPDAQVDVAITAPPDVPLSVSPSSHSFTLQLWDHPTTVKVTTLKDEDAVPAAPVAITHSMAGGGYDAVPNPDMVVTIRETDFPLVEIEPVEASVAEGRDARFRLTRAPPLSAEMTVRVNVEQTGQVIETAGDYEPPTEVVFDADAAETTLRVKTDGDDVYEADGAVTATLQERAAVYELGADPSARVTVASDDPEPRLLTETLIFDEADADAELTIRLTNPADRRITMDWATSPPQAGDPFLDAATAGADYTASSGTLTFEPGQREATVTVPLLDDDLVEGNEGFYIQISNLSGPVHVQVQVLRIPVLIGDHDSPPTLSIGNVSAGEESGTLDFKVRMNRTHSQEVTATWRIAYGTAAESASAADFVSPPAGTQTVTIAPGQMEFTISLTLNNDALDEFDETVTISLESPTNAQLARTPLEATGTIVDNDPEPTLTVTVADVEEDAGPLRFTASLSAPSGKDVTFQYETIESGETDATSRGTAAPTDDYTPTAAAITIAAGSTADLVIEVPVVTDDVEELDETVALRVFGVGNAQLASGSNIVTGTITNDDQAKVSIERSTNFQGGVVNEGAQLWFVVRRETAVVADPLTVRFTLEDNGNYLPTDGQTCTVTMPANERIVSTTSGPGCSPTITEDSTDEPDGTVTATLVADASYVIDSTKATATYTIRDNDDPPVLSIGDVEAAESAGTLTFTVELGAASDHTVEVNYATSDGTAEAPADYTAASGALTFDPGETSKQVVVTLVADSADEADTETFTMTLSSPAHATLADPPTATGTIKDDDRPTVSVEAVDATVPEGNQRGLQADPFRLPGRPSQLLRGHRRDRQARQEPGFGPRPRQGVLDRGERRPRAHHDPHHRRHPRRGRRHAHRHA